MTVSWIIKKAEKNYKTPFCTFCMKEVTDRLLEEGVVLFAEAFDKLLDAVEKAR